MPNKKMVTKAKLLSYAKEHGFFIHPEVTKDWEAWLKKANGLGRCPCSPHRPNCPCPESLEEVKNGKRGACCCTLFVNDRYIERYGHIFGGREKFLKPS